MVYLIQKLWLFFNGKIFRYLFHDWSSKTVRDISSETFCAGGKISEKQEAMLFSHQTSVRRRATCDKMLVLQIRFWEF